PARTGGEGQRGEMSRGDVVVEIGHPEARDRRHENQHLADHHKKDRQHEEAGRKASDQHRRNLSKPPPSHASKRGGLLTELPPLLAGEGRGGGFLKTLRMSRSYPKRARRRTRRRVRGANRAGV